MTSAAPLPDYPAALAIDYPDRELDRVSTAFRPIYAIPIFILVSAMTSILFFPVLLMVVFRRKYPRWFYDFNLQLTRLSTRAASYMALMSDEYPSSDEDQYVHLDFPYPDAEAELNQWLPLIKWFLAIPHYVVLAILAIGAIFGVIGAWFAILFTGRYPKGIFDYIEGVQRWALRVQAYAWLLTTDQYPPFSLR